MSTCLDCTHTLVPYREWGAMSLPERREAAASGKARAAARGLCARCYRNRLNRGALHDLPRVTMSRDDVLSEWSHLVGSQPPTKDAINAIAPRLGMTTSALEKALYRAKVNA